MFELALLGAVVVLMAKIADADDQSPILWGAIAFGLCLLSFLVPIPFIRVLFAGVAAFILMMVLKATRRR